MTDQRGSMMSEDYLAIVADEPTLDFQDLTPWRIPDGRFDEIQRRVADFAARDDLLEPKMQQQLPREVAPLLQGGRLARGKWRNFMKELVDPAFDTNAEPLDRDDSMMRNVPRAWWPVWTPPIRAAGDDRTGRERALRAYRVLDVFVGVDSVEPRRQALIGLCELRDADPTLRDFDLTAPADELPAHWREHAPPEVLEPLPELTSVLGYLAWVWAGFEAVHRKLAAAVPGAPDLVETVAQIIASCDDQEPRPELAQVAGQEFYEQLLTVECPPRKDWLAQAERWQLRQTTVGRLTSCGSGTTGSPGWP